MVFRRGRESLAETVTCEQRLKEVRLEEVRHRIVWKASTESRANRRSESPKWDRAGPAETSVVGVKAAGSQNGMGPDLLALGGGLVSEFSLSLQEWSVWGRF